MPQDSIHLQGAVHAPHARLPLKGRQGNHIISVSAARPLLQQHEPHPARTAHSPQEQKTHTKLAGSDHAALQSRPERVHGLLQAIDRKGE